MGNCCSYDDEPSPPKPRNDLKVTIHDEDEEKEEDEDEETEYQISLKTLSSGKTIYQIKSYKNDRDYTGTTIQWKVGKRYVLHIETTRIHPLYLTLSDTGSPSDPKPDFLMKNESIVSIRDLTATRTEDPITGKVFVPRVYDPATNETTWELQFKQPVEAFYFQCKAHEKMGTTPIHVS